MIYITHLNDCLSKLHKWWKIKLSFMSPVNSCPYYGMQKSSNQLLYLNKSTLDYNPPPLLKLSVNWLFVTCITNLSWIHKQTYCAHAQSEINDVKLRKIVINRSFWFFLPLLNLSENWFLATCGTNFNRILEKTYVIKLSCRQVNFDADADTDADTDDAELQLQ